MIELNNRERTDTLRLAISQIGFCQLLVSVRIVVFLLPFPHPLSLLLQLLSKFWVSFCFVDHA